MKTCNVSRKGERAQLLQQQSNEAWIANAGSTEPTRIAQQLAELLSLINQLYSRGNRPRRISEETNFTKAE